MNNENGSGWFAALILSGGIATIIATPFVIGHRYGLHILAHIVAMISIVFAILSRELVAMATDMGNSGQTYSQTLAQLIFYVDKIGWWWIAGFSLAYALLATFMVKAGWMPKSLLGK